MATIFVSYAHEDKALIDELRKHLAPLGNIWWDGEIPPGSEWNAEIEKQLDDADLVLLGISADFLNSEFIREHELPHALRRPGPVIPIILRPCLWEKQSFAHLQVLSAVDRDPDEAFTEIARSIGKLLEVVHAEIQNVPFRRNPNFTGRDALLAAVHKERRPVALAGLGGIGKTQTAVEYAYQYGREYDLIWWIASEEPTTRASMYASLAPRLGLPASDQATAINAVRQELERRERWLLIFDNVEDPKDLDPYLPHRGKGKVLITSRVQAWGRVAKAIPVHPLEREKSIDLLLGRTAQTDRHAANQLAEELGDLPLALDQAASYMEKTAIAVKEYLALFRTRRDELWKDEEPPEDYPATVATTWSLAFDQLSPEAIALMNMASVLAPEPIPRSLIEACAKFCEEGAAGHELLDPLVRNRAVAALLEQSLITADETTILMHRLVQTIARDRMGGAEEERWKAIVLKALNSVFPHVYPSTARTCALMMPHGLLAIAQTELSFGAGYLLNQMALYAQTLIGDLRLAARLLDEVINLPYSEAEANTFATHLINRASIAYDFGELQKAKQLLQRAITIREKMSPASIVNSLIMYASVLRELEDADGARAAVDRALELSASGDSDGDNVRAKFALAVDLWRRGEVVQALEIIQQVIGILEKVPEEALSLSAACLEAARMAIDAGDLATARSFNERSLKIRRQMLGEQHMQVGMSLVILGDIEMKCSNLQEARSAYQRAYEILLPALGANNGWTKGAAAGLASLRP
ncbi:MAG TPA: FxSxx-COOH system tetratricopeptide repeat protein [Thermoanaerobaculia bacterium]|nr:FxSxx-COOH system tetratricopeptide repeat protein [Thermoanaerobaculia bacterium]